MSWLNDLYLTYEACKSEAGIIRDAQPLLLPIAHLTQNAQLEVVLDGEGNFVRAYRVDKGDAVTVIPITEDSGSRSGSAVYPHPLADKLEYIAGDYGDFFPLCKKEKYETYLTQLEEWALSDYTLPSISSVYLYLKKSVLMHDLLAAGFFAYTEDGIIAEKQQGVPAEDWFVRFSVEIPGRKESRLYCDTQVFDSYTDYYLSKQEKKELSYVSGETEPCCEKHPAKIRHTGDKAKLISSNDTSGFTYRGRFEKSGHVASVSYEISQKAHNALRWLIAKQACLRAGEQVFVVWSVENPKVENPFAEFFGEGEESTFSDEAYGARVRKAIWGTDREPEGDESVMVIGVEAATTGRLSIPFYQKYGARQFLQNIAKWKTEACWPSRSFHSGKNRAAVIWSPSLIDIVKLVAGDKNEKLNKSMRERLVPCVVEGRRLPGDVVFSAVKQAINPMHYDSNQEWDRAVTITCALLRKWQIERGNKGAGWDMELNEKSEDRSYIFGQLLATAEMLERRALTMGGGKDPVRNTAAEKYFVRFQRYPVETWNTIRNQLQPYVLKLQAAGKSFYIDHAEELTARLDLTKREKLEPTFLQGYSCQMMEYRKYFKETGKEQSKEEQLPVMQGEPEAAK